MNTLTLFPKPGSTQANFENLMIRHFGMRAGVFAIETLHCVNSSSYVNMHVQWMWQQYQQHIRPKEQKPK